MISASNVWVRGGRVSEAEHSGPQLSPQAQEVDVKVYASRSNMENLHKDPSQTISPQNKIKTSVGGMLSKQKGK